MGTYKDNDYKVLNTTVTFSGLNRKRQVMAVVESDTDDNITDFTEAMAVINYIKRTM
jgi:hypothetical protein